MNREVPLDHVEVVSTGFGLRIAFDEPGVEGWAIIAMGRPPKVVILLRLQNWNNVELRRFEVGDFDEHVDHGLGFETRNGRATEMLNTTNDSRRETRYEVAIPGCGHIRFRRWVTGALRAP